METLRERYFRWLCETIRSAEYENYSALLRFLYERPFTYILPEDERRAINGAGLRNQFLCSIGYSYAFPGELNVPCSVLEMLVDLAVRCENGVVGLSYSEEDNRPGRFFWFMITNLGLWVFTDSYFDQEAVEKIIKRFLYREYEPDGTGGLFIVSNHGDLRKASIWYQAMWYISNKYGN